MAGMFYSLQEAAEKLNKTEDEIKQLVQEGKLREFRDGTNLLFKVDEVEALVSDVGEEKFEEILNADEVQEAAEAEEMEEPEAGPEAESEEEAEHELEPEAELELEPETEPEPELEPASEAELEEKLEPEPETETESQEKPEPESEAGHEEEIPELEESKAGTAEEEKPEESAFELEAAESEDKPFDSSEILLAPESGELSSDLTNADTALTGQGTSVLGDTDQGYDLTDDSLAETVFAKGPTGSTPEVPLEEVEEDVNLDSFGSGSGLLDLSLQADDTSLGGILDEIYTTEGEGQEAGAPGPGVEPEPGMEAAPVEGEQPSEEGIAAAPQAMPEMAAIAQPMIEVAPDTQSKILGMILILPLIIVVYTIIVVIAGMKGIMPSILQSIQGFVWYIMGGAIVVSALVAGGAFVLTGERAAKPKKEKKPKVKKEKPKKEKKKKEKKAKKSK